MSHNQNDQNENLNAFIDNQLATDERIQIFDSLKKDEKLSHTLCELQRNDELLSLAYNTIPKSPYDPYAAATKFSQRTKQMIAAGLLVILSAAFGWQFHLFYNSSPGENIQDIAYLSSEKLQNSKVIIHVSKMDPDRINTALDKAELLLNQQKDIQLEVLANAEGIGLLRTNSPYASRIESLSKQHKNLSFKACGIALKTVELKEGHDIELLPEAEKIPAGLDQILKRLKLGWLYVKA